MGPVLDLHPGDQAMVAPGGCPDGLEVTGGNLVGNGQRLASSNQCDSQSEQRCCCFTATVRRGPQGHKGRSAHRDPGGPRKVRRAYTGGRAPAKRPPPSVDGRGGRSAASARPALRCRPARPRRRRRPPPRRRRRGRPASVTRRSSSKRYRRGAPVGMFSSAMSASEMSSRCFTRARKGVAVGHDEHASTRPAVGARPRRASRAARARRRPPGTPWTAGRRGRAAGSGGSLAGCSGLLGSDRRGRDVVGAAPL